jgi:membrane-associated phospholipid phosphatase
MPFGRTSPMRSLRALCTSFLIVCLPTSSLSQTTSAASESQVSLFTRNDIYLGAVFILGTAALAPFDERVAHRLQQPDAQAHRNIQHLATAVRLIADPGFVIIGISLYTIGRISHHTRLADLGLHGTEAIAVGSIVSVAIKGTTGRSRPYVTHDTTPRDFGLFRGFTRGRDYASFPSGHALAAFAAASAVTAEAGRWNHNSQWAVGTLMYGGASAVALSRLYNDQHWASDVILAAGIGTFAGNKVVRYQHRTSPRNRLDRWLLSASISSGPDGEVHLTISPRMQY